MILVLVLFQGSSERGIGLVVAADKAKAMIEEKEFENDFLF
jgi:aspartokinase/homoserine dehydrogenase 1